MPSKKKQGILASTFAFTGILFWLFHHHSLKPDQGHKQHSSAHSNSSTRSTGTRSRSRHSQRDRRSRRLDDDDDWSDYDRHHKQQQLHHNAQHHAQRPSVHRRNTYPARSSMVNNAPQRDEYLLPRQQPHQQQAPRDARQQPSGGILLNPQPRPDYTATNGNPNPNHPAHSRPPLPTASASYTATPNSNSTSTSSTSTSSSSGSRGMNGAPAAIRGGMPAESAARPAQPHHPPHYPPLSAYRQHERPEVASPHPHQRLRSRERGRERERQIDRGSPRGRDAFMSGGMGGMERDSGERAARM